MTLTSAKSRAIKQKGTSWESAIVKYCEDNGVPATRRQKAGNKDNGDINLCNNLWTVEAKSVATINLPGFLRELDVEMINSKAPWGAVWIKRRGKSSPAEGYVVMEGRQFVELVRQVDLSTW